MGSVHLDDRDARERQRVTDRARVVRPGAGIDDRAVGEVAQAVQLLDELALVVGLKEARVELELAGERVDRLLELQERHAAVVLRVAPPDLVEVDAVHDVDAVARGGHLRVDFGMPRAPTRALAVRSGSWLSPGRSRSPRRADGAARSTRPRRCRCRVGRRSR